MLGVSRTIRASFSTAFLAALVAFGGCETTSGSAAAGPRTIVLNGVAMSEEIYGRFVSWRCRDYVRSGPVLVEVGHFTVEEDTASIFGFVLYDGGSSGEFTSFGRAGINRRWDWGGENSSTYAFILEPDGTGLFYDFSAVSKGQTTRARNVYKCVGG